jgi:hypothetical protein
VPGWLLSKALATKKKSAGFFNDGIQAHGFDRRFSLYLAFGFEFLFYVGLQFLANLALETGHRNCKNKVGFR